VNVTVTPDTGLLYASTTFAVSAFANAAPITAVCELPDATLTALAVPALTVIVPLVALGLLLESATVIVSAPAVFSVMLNVPTPAVRLNVPVGKTAFVSVEVNVTGPV
jgi:hypothetical protein